MSQKWRLINGEELYHVGDDLAQRNNLAERMPAKVAEMKKGYLEWWESVSPRMTPVSIALGDPSELKPVLCSQDWYLETGNPPWNFGTISKLPRVTGPWKIDVKEAGRYRLTLRQFPKEADREVRAVKARIRVAGSEEEQEVMPGTKGVVFDVNLPAGKTDLLTYLYDEKGKVGGAYFTEVEKLP